MFALPDAKRVRRTELYSSSSTSPEPCPSPSTEAQLRARLNSLFAPLGVPEQSAPQILDHEGGSGASGKRKKVGGEEEDEIDFCMFAGAVQKVSLVEEIPVKGEGGLVPGRDPRVWFVGRAEKERALGIRMMARSGEEVREGARARAWGLEVPWRVKVIRVARRLDPKPGIKGGGHQEVGNDVVLGVEKSAEVGKRRKPGKKRRILLRQKKKKADELTERKKLEMARREESEKEKKARKNRERKLKRRAKVREKKGEAQTKEDGDVTGGADSDSGGDQD